MRRGVTIAVVVLAGSGTAAGVAPRPALAVPGWTAPANFPFPANALTSSVRMAYQSGGTATVAYLELVSTSPVQTVLHAGVIPPGGAYQETLRIASTSTSIPTDVALAEAPSGAAVVEWAALTGSDPNNSPYAGLATYRPPGSSSWEAPATLATDTTRTLGIYDTLAPAVSADGTAAAGFDRVDPSVSPAGNRIDVAVHPPGGSWHPTSQISPSAFNYQSSENLALGFDAHGNLTAAFKLRLSNNNYTLAVRRRPATSGVWGSLEDITGSDITANTYPPALGVAPDGGAVLAYQYVSSNSGDVNAVTRSGASGAWTAPADVASGGSETKAAGVSANDEAYIVYKFYGAASGQNCLGVVRARLGGAFSAPRCVSPTNFAPNSSGLAFLGNDAYMAWAGKTNGASSYVVEGSRWLDAASQPDSFTDLEAPGTSNGLQQVLADDDGSVAAFWTNSQSTLRAAAFDAGGPNLLSASVPATAVAGQPVAMSASFADLWSGLAGSPIWSFGDGSQGSGAQVSHTFSAPGTYAVTVTASDGLGNPTSATYTIAVSSPPPTPPTSPPTITNVGESVRKWRAGNGLAKITDLKRGVPVGTTFRFSLNETATVQLAFTRAATGRRVAGKCVRRTTRNARKRRCAMVVTDGTLTFTGHPGPNQVSFQGRLPTRKLAPGSYTLVITATAGGQRSVPKTLTFTIVKG